MADTEIGICDFERVECLVFAQVYTWGRGVMSGQSDQLFVTPPSPLWLVRAYVLRASRYRRKLSYLRISSTILLIFCANLRPFFPACVSRCSRRWCGYPRRRSAGGRPKTCGRSRSCKEGGGADISATNRWTCSLTRYVLRNPIGFAVMRSRRRSNNLSLVKQLAAGEADCSEVHSWSEYLTGKIRSWFFLYSEWIT